MRFYQEFRPTPAMQFYAYQRAKQGENPTEKALAADVPVTPETISRWKQIKGFTGWLEEQVQIYRTPILQLIEQTAIKNINDYRFWEAIAKKYGFISKETDQPPGEDAGLRMTPSELVELIQRTRETLKPAAKAEVELSGRPQ